MTMWIFVLPLLAMGRSGVGELVGLPGVPSRAHPQQGGGCLCTDSTCGCADGYYCAAGGLCFPCNTTDCRGGCGCPAGQICSTTGQCLRQGSTVVSTCAGLTCTSGHGYPVWDGVRCSCQCYAMYSGTACGQCAYGFAGYPACTSSSTCAGVHCKNGGAAHWSQNVCRCQCRVGYAGPLCEQCSAGYRGYPSCTADHIQACNGVVCESRGTPYWSVGENRCRCRCPTGYAGDTCGMCAAGYTGYPNCSGGVGSVSCTMFQCQNHGVGRWDGIRCSCVCAQGFAGATCGQCAAGYHSYPTCVSGVGWRVATPSPSWTAATPPPMTQLGQCTVQDGVTYAGVVYKSVATRDAALCCSACMDERPTCVGWSWEKATNICRLKNQLGTPVSDVSVVSGTPGAALGGEDDDDLSAAIIAIVVAVALLLCACFAVWAFLAYRRRKKRHVNPPETHKSPPPPLEPSPVFSTPIPPPAAPPPPVRVSPVPPRPLHNTIPDEVTVSHDPDPIPPESPPPHSPVNPLDQLLAPSRPVLTKENAELNDFLHRRDGTFA